MDNETNPSGVGRLFLSYAREDDKTFVAELYEHLRGEGFEVWWDMVDMPSRGLTFLDEIRRAIQAADRVLLVIGPDAIASEYVRAEWQCALAEGKVVVPLLRLGTFEDLPVELHPLNCLDHSKQRSTKEAFAELLEKLKAPVPDVGKLYGAVAGMPTRYQPRPADYNNIASLVFADLEAPISITAGQRVIVVHGMGGVGKSVLAAAFARSTSTRRTFDHGIYWIRAGSSVETLRRLAALLELSVAQTADVDLLSSRVRDALDGRRVLIVIDDATGIESLEAILGVLAVRTRVLVTSRDAKLASLAGSRDFPLQELEIDQALQLLADWAGADPETLPSDARSVAERCGGIPLALALNGAVAASSPWSDVLGALKEADLEFARRRIADYKHRTVWASLQVSISALANQEPMGPDRYSELVIFQSEDGIPEQAVTKLWTQTGGLKPRDGRELITALARSALVRLDGTEPTRRLVLHNLLQLYLRAMETKTSHLHAALIDAYRAASPSGWANAEPDDYLHDHLIYHLLRADKVTEANSLCLDPAWFTAVERAKKTSSTDAFLASLDLVIETARTADDMSTLVQACLVASRFTETGPPEVVEVFADAGQIHRAERIAGAIVFALDRCRAFCILAERMETEEERQRCLTEARRCLGSIDHTQRGMALYWICRALNKAGAHDEANKIAEEAWANAKELDEDDEWNIPYAQLWAAKVFRLLGNDEGLKRVRQAVKVIGRNLDLQTAGLCGDVDALQKFPSETLYPISIVRPGNLALACATAGLKKKRDEVLDGPNEGEADAVRRFAWALALAGRFAESQTVILDMDDHIEQAKAVRRVISVAAQSNQTSEIPVNADLAETLADAVHDAQSDAWRIRAHLACALSLAGRHEAACALAEKVIAQGIAPTEENTLIYPERLRQVSPHASPFLKTGPRPLDTNVKPLPDENAAARVIEFALAGNLDAANAELEQIRLPRARAKALLTIAQHEPIADIARLRWIDALLYARNVGRRQLDEVLSVGQAGVDSALAQTIETLDECWSSAEAGPDAINLRRIRPITSPPRQKSGL